MGRRSRKRGQPLGLTKQDEFLGQSNGFLTESIDGRPKVIIGAPVAERRWILPRWWECLAKQTHQPSGFCFVYSDSHDDTRDYLSWPEMGPSFIYDSKIKFVSRDDRNINPSDPWQAKHMSDLRNELRSLFLKTNGDIFISLDTDLLLENENVIEELVKTLDENWDVVSPITYLHPIGKASQAYNAGFLGPGDLSDFGQFWNRATMNEVVSFRSPVKIDIPMAAIAMRRHVLGMCKYKPHELGEDIGFAQNLKAREYRVAWRTDLEVRHVWNASYLETKV